MGPLQFNNGSSTNAGCGHDASLSSSSSSSLTNSPRNPDQYFGEETVETDTVASTNKKGKTERDREEQRNEQDRKRLQSRGHNGAWPHRRLLYTLQYFLQKNATTLKYGTAAGMIVAAIAVAVHKQNNGRRRQWIILSLLARLNLLGANKNTNTNTNTNANAIENKNALKQFCKSLYGTLINLLRSPDYAYADSASLSLLRTAAQSGVVQQALIGATDIVFSTRDNGWKKTSLPPQSPGLKSDLLDLLTKGGCSEISTLPDSFWQKAATPILTAFPFVYLAFAYRMLKGMQNGNLDGDGGDFFTSKLLSMPRHKNNKTNNAAMDGKKISFSDIAGLDVILPEVREIVSYLRHPSGFHALGAEPPRGILLHGSPGVGKTLIAKAIAGEANCDAFCVCSGSDFCEMYVGRGAGRVRTLFREARRTALRNYNSRHGLGGTRWLWPWGFGTKDNIDDTGLPPATAIIFIDELDALAKSRSYGGVGNSNDERDQTLNQLLTEMDGFFRANNTSAPSSGYKGEENVNIIVVAATNRAEVLDPAILRRFDRQIKVPYPDKKGRLDILKVHAAKTHCRFSTIHWDYLAEETPNFSGSDLKQVVNDAALLAVRQQSKHIEQGHLLQSIQRARAMKVQNDIVGRGSGYSMPSMLPFVCRS